MIATVEADNKTAVEKALAELRKLDDESRKPLFFSPILEEVWHTDIVVKYIRRKKNEYLDNDLAKVLEDHGKLDYKRELDRGSAN
jgi:hypothetical protein